MRRFALLAALAAVLSAPQPALAVDKSLDGGAHIWAGSGWGEFRAYVGPRFKWDWFSIYPYGAIGPAFFNGVQGSPVSLGVYNDAVASIPLAESRWIQLGVGGGGGHILGLGSTTGPIIPQAYGMLNFRWDGNTVGVMGLWGRAYDSDPALGTNFPKRLNFSGIGLRFEYQIEDYAGLDD